MISGLEARKMIFDRVMLNPKGNPIKVGDKFLIADLKKDCFDA